MVTILLICWTILNALTATDAKLVEGFLDSGSNWEFLSRFCFRSTHGRFQYEVSFDEGAGNPNLDLYYDSPQQWSMVYGGESKLKTCIEKESVLQVENNQFINLTVEAILSGCKRTNISSIVWCKGSRNFDTVRDRWWFVAISNCNSSNGIQIKYRFLLTNGKPGDLLHYHFSADQFYILPILIVASSVHLSLSMLAFWSAIGLKQKQLLHVTFKLFMVSVFIHTFGVSLLCVHYFSYAFNGVGIPKWKSFGQIMEAIAEIVFLLLLILLAKGYTVTRAKLRTASVVKVSVLMSLYSVSYFLLFITEKLYFDPGEVVYRYESFGGYGLLILKFVGWVMFIYSTFFSLKHFPEKGGFFYPFFSFFTLWFIAGPILIIASNHIISAWVREKVVVSVEHFLTLLAHTVFLYLTRPNAYNNHFPYHVRTSQIGHLQNDNTSLSDDHRLNHIGNPTANVFYQGGLYEVNDSNGAPASADIFTVDSMASNNQRKAIEAPSYQASS